MLSRRIFTSLPFSTIVVSALWADVGLTASSSSMSESLVRPMMRSCASVDSAFQALGADVEQQVAGRGHRMARSGPDLAERMQLRRPRRAEEPIPRLRSKPHHAGQASLKIAETHGANQRRQISAQR